MPKAATYTKLALCLLIAAPAMAVRPKAFIHATEADFKEGTSDGVVVNNQGAVKLSPGQTEITDFPEGVTAVYDAVVLTDGSVYLSAGPGGYLLKQEDEAVETVTQVQDGEIFSLGQLNGQLVAAVSPVKQDAAGYLAALSDGAISPIADLPKDTRYAWDLLAAGTHIFVATGSPGQILKLDMASPDKPEPVVVLDAKQPNLLCLAATESGVIYAGSDEDGLVYKLSPQEDGGYLPFVAFDALEPEIGVLMIDDDVVYAGTADAQQANPGSLVEPQTEDTGKPAPGSPEAPGNDTGDSGDEEAPSLPGGNGDQPTPPVETPEPEELAETDPAADTAETDEETTETEPATEDAAETGNETPATAEDAEPEAIAPVVTSEMRDRLREAIRQRLLAARKTGKIKPPSSSGTSKASSSGPKMRAAKQEPKEGNAVYRINADGFVSEVFRDSVMILDLAKDAQGNLLIATGNEGQVYRVDAEMGEQSVLTDLENTQITALAVQDGQVLATAANPAGLISLSSDTRPRGQFISVPLDTTQISLFGALSINAELPEGTSVLVETRSGNISDPESVDEAFGWSPWSQAVSFVADDRPAITPRIAQIGSPPARYLQYRLTLVGDGSSSPAIEKLRANYIVPNQAPKITTIKAEYPEAQDARPESNQLPPAAPNLNITWEATDPNEDRLLYTLSYQPAGSDTWIDIAEDGATNEFGWDTRRVPDGRYLLKITADDQPDNPGDMALTTARISAPVVVDNTAPVIQQVEVKEEDASIFITGWAIDQVNPIPLLGYAVDSTDRYQALLPDDLIADSTQEAFTIKLLGSSDSPADRPSVVTLRAIDARGNVAYQSVVIPAKP